MKDQEYLMWLHERLEHVHREPAQADYMHKLRAIIEATPEDKETPNVELSGPEAALSPEGAMLNDLLGRVPTEDKAAVFDGLVREFQGKARFVHMKRRTREVKTGPGPHETSIIYEDYPVYEYVLRVDGHDDFAAAILALLK